MVLGYSCNFIHVSCNQEPAPVGKLGILIRNAEEVDVMNLKSAVLNLVSLAVISEEGVYSMELVKVDVLVKQEGKDYAAADLGLDGESLQALNVLVVVIKGKEALVVPPLHVRYFFIQKNNLTCNAVNRAGNAETSEIGEFTLSHSNAGYRGVLKLLHADILY